MWKVITVKASPQINDILYFLNFSIMQNLLNEPQHTLRFWGCGKVVSFRLSEKALTNLEYYAKKITKKNRNKTLNIILESLGTTPKRSEQPKKQETGDFFSLPPFLYCDREKTWLLRDSLLDPHNDVGCLMHPCQKTCPAWRHKQLF